MTFSEQYIKSKFSDLNYNKNKITKKAFFKILVFKTDFLQKFKF